MPARLRGSWAALFALVVVYLTPLWFVIYLQTSSHADQKRASKSFARVRATVVESGVAPRGKGKGWFAKITYQYEVDGRTYASSRISFTGTETSGLLRGGPSREDAAATAAEHSVGSTIDAYYDPTDPSQAVRDVSLPSSSPLTRILLLLLVAVLLGLLGVSARGPRVRVSFPGPRVPESWITAVLFLGCLASFAAAAWYVIASSRGPAQDDLGTAFAFVFIGSMLLWTWRQRRRTQRDAA